MGEVEVPANKYWGA